MNWVVFVKLERACDGLLKEELRRYMKKMGVADKHVMVVQETYEYDVIVDLKWRWGIKGKIMPSLNYMTFHEVWSLWSDYTSGPQHFLRHRPV